MALSVTVDRTAAFAGELVLRRNHPVWLLSCRSDRFIPGDGFVRLIYRSWLCLELYKGGMVGR